MLAKGTTDEKNRQALESKNTTILESIEAGSRHDTLKKLDTGFNHVLAAIAAKKGIAIRINLGEIRALTRIEKAKRLAKIRYNLKIARKAHTSFIIQGTKKEAPSLLISLGASTQQAKSAQSQSF